MSRIKGIIKGHRETQDRCSSNMRNIKCYKVKGRECLKVKGMAHDIGEFKDVQSEKYQDISVGFRDNKIARSGSVVL